ncbi:unnamed protein product, partial [Brassica oleracea]
MKEKSKEDEEHVRGLLETLIKCLDENKIVLRIQLLEGIRHLNIKKLLDYQIKILDDVLRQTISLLKQFSLARWRNADVERKLSLLKRWRLARWR